MTHSIILAAGGILTRKIAGCLEVAVIYRNRYKDWCLPKGKLKKDESWDGAASREVKEETGCDAEIAGFAGAIHYVVNDTPKVVFFYEMKIKGECHFQSSEEVKELIWLTPERAIKRLDYDLEKKIIRDFYISSEKSYSTKLAIWISHAFNLRSYKRLSETIQSYRSEFKIRIEQSNNKTWINSADELLNKAESALENNDIDKGWKCFHAAKRMEIFGFNDADLETTASILREESGKLNSWRKRATNQLLGTTESPKKKVTNEQVYQATLLRDESFGNKYYRIGLIKSQLKMLSIIFIILLSSILLYFYSYPLENDISKYTNIDIIIGVVLFGLLGSTFSAFLSLQQTSVSASIPEMVANFLITIMRVVVGAGSALMIFVFLKAGILAQIFNFNFDVESSFTFFTISFIAGFSERLVVRAVKSVTGT